MTEIQQTDWVDVINDVEFAKPEEIAKEYKRLLKLVDDINRFNAIIYDDLTFRHNMSELIREFGQHKIVNNIKVDKE